MPKVWVVREGDFTWYTNFLPLKLRVYYFLEGFTSFRFRGGFLTHGVDESIKTLEGYEVKHYPSKNFRRFVKNHPHFKQREKNGK